LKTEGITGRTWLVFEYMSMGDLTHLLRTCTADSSLGANNGFQPISLREVSLSYRLRLIDALINLNIDPFDVNGGANCIRDGLPFNAKVHPPRSRMSKLFG